MPYTPPEARVRTAAGSRRRACVARAPRQAPCQHAPRLLRARRPFYDLSVGLSAARVPVTAGGKPLGAVGEGALAAGAAEHICALGP